MCLPRAGIVPPHDLPPAGKQPEGEAEGEEGVDGEGEGGAAPGGGGQTDKEDTNDVFIMNTKHEDRATSFFAQPGILAGNLITLFFNLLIVHIHPTIFCTSTTIQTSHTTSLAS